MSTLTTGKMYKLEQECLEKLHPDNVRPSPKFHAYLAYLIGVREGWTKPRIVSMAITSDDFVVVQPEGEHDYIESASNLRMNITGIAEAVGLSDAARDWLLEKCRYRGGTE